MIDLFGILAEIGHGFMRPDQSSTSSSASLVLVQDDTLQAEKPGAILVQGATATCVDLNVKQIVKLLTVQFL